MTNKIEKKAAKKAKKKVAKKAAKKVTKKVTKKAVKSPPKNGKVLTREDILSLDDCQGEELWVPEWDGWVHIKRLNCTERDHLEGSLILSDKKKSYEGIRAKISSLCVCDKAGTPLFTKDDLQALAAKSASAQQRIFDACLSLNGFSDEDVEGMAKN